MTQAFKGPDMEAGWRQEIVELHQFFEQWLSGALPSSDAAFGRLEQVLAREFALVGPAGALMGRAAVVKAVRGAHGSRPGLRIRIDNARLHCTEETLHLATYEEWQHSADASKGRLSSVLFRGRAGTPNGLEWVHVHETWLPPRADH